MPADYRVLTNEQFDEALNKLPSKVVTLPAGSSPWAFVNQHFKVPPSSNGRVSAYGQSLLNRILDLNKISDPTKVTPGRILVPSLPSFTTAINRSAQNKPVHFSEGTTAEAVVQIGPIKMRAGIQPYRFKVSKETAATLLHSSELQAFKPIVVDTPESPASAMEFRLVADGQASAVNQDFLSASDKQAVIHRLSGSHKTTTLFILDACWPTPTERKAAYQALAAMTAKANGETGAGLVAPSEPTGWAEPTNNHCQEIAKAIQPLEGLDAPQSGDPAVRVIYVPLTKEQGAEPFLKGLVSLGNFIRRYQSEGAGWPDLTPAGQKNVALAAQKESAATLAIVPSAWGPNTKVRSSSAIFERLQAIAAFTAQLDDTRYIISASWIAAVNSLLDVSQQPTNGLIVAATGNQGALIDQGPNGQELAYRAYFGPGVIAVANGEFGKGLICCSSYLEDATFTQTDAVVFNGSLSFPADDNTCPAKPNCGTSFSTPRAAWLIAATEATRSQTQHGVWSRDVTDAVKAARVTSNCPWKGYLEITSLFRQRP